MQKLFSSLIHSPLAFALLLFSQVVTAANYDLPVDIGSGAFSGCAGGGSVYTCGGNLNIANNDTVTLSGDVTLTVNGNLDIGKDVVISNGGFVFNFDVNGNVDIDKDTVIAANLTTTGDLKTKKKVTITGNLSASGNIELDDDNIVSGSLNAVGNLIIDKKSLINGDITAGGNIEIDKDIIVNGNVIAGGNLDIGKNSVVNGTCSPTHPQCNGGGGSGSTCTTVKIANDGEEFKGISGSSDSNIIAVGRDGGIYHYDGTSWAKNAFVAPEKLEAVVVVSSSLAVAVGHKGGVFQYDGDEWSILPAPSGENLDGVWAISSNEIWVVGKKGTLFLWNGASWSDMSGAGQANIDNNADLKAAWGDVNSFYALEKDGDLYRYSRTTGPWSKFNACNAGFDIDAKSIWGDGAGNIYIAGKDKGLKEAAVFLYNETGNTCSKLISSSLEDKVESISGNGSTVFAVGKKGLVLDNSTGSWAESKQGNEDFKAVWVSPSNTAYYAGKKGFLTTCTDPGSLLDHFSITPGTTSASICTANAITIIAEDASNNPVTTYANQVDISVSSNHGNWSINAADNVTVPNPDNDDNGDVSYTYLLSDAGEIVLNFNNTHAETLTITVFDSVEGVTSSSVTISFADNVFVITEDTVQVAGRPMSMQLAMWTNNGANCFIDTNYNYDPHDLEVSIDRAGVLPLANNPTIGGSAIQDGSTAAITFDFASTPGQTSFNLDTTDVGQYRLIISDTSNTHGVGVITGTSGLMTVRPFGISVTSIVSTVGAVANPGNTLPAQPAFIAAGADMSARVAGVLWSGADDTDNDGVLDTGVYAGNAIAPSYAWSTVLSARSIDGYTPIVGTAGSVDNGGIAAIDFGNGFVDLTDLQYDEVGSFTLETNADDFLGLAAADIAGDPIVIGRFIPAMFDVGNTLNGDFSQSCGTFTYIGQDFGYQAMLEPQFTVTAQNVAGDTTEQYRGTFAKLDASSVVITNVTSDLTTQGTDMVLLDVSYTPGVLSFTAQDDGTVDYTFGADTYRYGPDLPLTTVAKFPNSQVAEFGADIDLIIESVADGDVTTAFPVSPATTIEPTANLNRFGRLRMNNIHGTELIPLTMSVTTEYWNGNAWLANIDDSCTAIDSVPDLIPTPAGFSDPTVVLNPAIAGIINYNFPVPASSGSVDTITNLDATGADHLWLRYDWDSDLDFDDDPVAKTTFGIFEGNPVQIFIQQIYQ